MAETTKVAVERVRLGETFFFGFTSNLVPFAASLRGHFIALETPFLHPARIGLALIIVQQASHRLRAFLLSA